MALDGNAPFPLQIHVVQGLGHHIPGGYRMGGLEQAVRKGALTMIDVGNDAKVADVLHKGCKDREHGAEGIGRRE